MEYSIQIVEGVFQIKTTGTGTLSGFLTFIEAVLTHPEWIPGTKVLVDHSDLNIKSMTFGNISEIADFCVKHANRIGNAKIALVVSDDLNYGLNRIWTSLVYKRLDDTNNIFKSRDEALQWLSVSTKA